MSNRTSSQRWTGALLGARMHYAVPRILYHAGRLERIYTDVHVGTGLQKLIGRLTPGLIPRGLRRLAQRHIVDVPGRLITAFNRFGFEYQHRLSRARSVSEQTAIYLWAGQAFSQLILAHGPAASSNLYCFNSAGLELLRDWRLRGRRGVVEQTIAPRRIEERILREEEAAYPDWEPPLPRDTHVDAYIEREEAEWALADAILCGSEFVRDGIAACRGPVERCLVVPYGVPIQQFRTMTKPPLVHRALRVLTVGSVGLRKGSHYVWEAARRLPDHVQFRLVGPCGLLPQRIRELGKVAELTGPVPRGEIIQHLEWADVFLLPSLCEGSATVTYEALSAGLPVIATPNAGSIVEDGVSGFIVPARDADAIVAVLERLLIEPGLLEQLRAGARIRSQAGSLEAYGERLLKVLIS